MTDDAIDALRTRAAQANQPVFGDAARHFYSADVPADSPPFDTLAECVQDGADLWVAYPSGLAQTVDRINWFWVFDDRAVRLGTAQQAMRYATRNGIDPSLVACVHPDDVHGTCVAFNDGRLVQAQSFPAWTGV